MSIKILFQNISNLIIASYTTIATIIKNTYKIILTNKIRFLSLILISLFLYIFLAIILILSFMLPKMLLSSNLLVFIVLCFLLIAFYLGILIGYHKIIFNFIDGKNIRLKMLFENFDILPRILLINLISAIIPTFGILYLLFAVENSSGLNLWLLIYQDIETSALYDSIFYNLLHDLTNIDIIIILSLSLLYLWFKITFWPVIRIAIDRNLSVLVAFQSCKKLNNNKFSLAMTFIIIYLGFNIFNGSTALLVNELYIIFLSFSSLCWFLFWSTYYRKIIN